jgi:glycosyltransferase involved in cell wall biosynthesis
MSGVRTADSDATLAAQHEKRFQAMQVEEQAAPIVGRRRLRVLMVCAHEPTMDPRIGWEAKGAAERFDVTVLGFHGEGDARPSLERRDGYEIRRVRREMASLVRFAWHLKDVLGATATVLLAAVALLLSPFLLAAVALGALTRTLSVAARARLRDPKGPAERLVARLARALMRNRVRMVLVVVRAQFAAATTNFWAHIQEMPEKPDVVHCNDLDTLLVGALARKSYGCRLVYDAHEYYPHSDPEGGWLDTVVFHALEKVLVHKADAVVTVNPKLAEVMQRAYGLRQIHSVPNAEPWTERAAALPPSTMTQFARGRVKFLFQGRFSAGRGLEEVVAAWKRVDAARAALFLRGPDNLWRRQLIDLAQRLGTLDRSVYFLDPVGEEELVAAAAEADIGMIPYKGEIEGYKYACPNKLSQYLHAGLMVVTNDLPYVREVLEESGAGLHYRSYDADSLVQVVERIVKEPELLRRSRSNALRYAQGTFNWQSFSQTLYKLYLDADPGHRKSEKRTGALAGGTS